MRKDIPAWADEKYVYSYHIIITNNSNDTVQLMSRHWVITDAFGNTREVKGLGVVGRQPTLSPGQKHEYVSWCPFTTEVGLMKGSFTMMKSDSDEEFEVIVPPFTMVARPKCN